MNESNELRTEHPTPRRRRQVRRQGHVARSAQLVGAVVLLGASAGLTVMGGSMATQLLETLEQQLQTSATLDAQPERIMQLVHNLFENALWAVLPLLAALFLLAAGANLLQMGFLVAPAAIKPQWSRLNPARGLARSLSGANLVDAALNSLKAAAVVGMAGVMLWRELPALSRLSRLGPQQLAAYSSTRLGSFALTLSAALCILAMFDYAVQHWRHARSLRMTRDELREDQRELEGDPMLQQRRLAARSSLIHQRDDALRP